MKKKDSGCACGDQKEVILNATLSRDALPCGRCGREIAVDAIPAPPDVTQKLRRWVDQHYAIEMLWFSSAEYEAWSKGELDNPKSKINRLGLELARELPAWHYFAAHAQAEQFIDRFLDPCPFCNGITEESGFGGRFARKCGPCRVVGPGDE